MDHLKWCKNIRVKQIGLTNLVLKTQKKICVKNTKRSVLKIIPQNSK